MWPLCGPRSSSTWAREHRSRHHKAAKNETFTRGSYDETIVCIASWGAQVVPDTSGADREALGGLSPQKRAVTTTTGLQQQPLPQLPQLPQLPLSILWRRRRLLLLLRLLILLILLPYYYCYCYYHYYVLLLRLLFS